MILHKLYNDTEYLYFDEGKHKYYYDDKEVPSVTKITDNLSKPQLPAWAAKCGAEWFSQNVMPGMKLSTIDIDNLIEGIKSAHKNIFEAAGDNGTAVHERISRGDFSPSGDAKLDKCVALWQAWLKDHHTVDLFSERLVFSKTHKYAGTLDKFMMVDTFPEIVDAKTSNGIWPNYDLQVAGYAVALEEEFPGYASMGSRIGRRIVQINADNDTYKEKIIEPRNFIKDDAAFIALIEIHKWRKKS